MLVSMEWQTTMRCISGLGGTHASEQNSFLITIQSPTVKEHINEQPDY